MMKRPAIIIAILCAAATFIGGFGIMYRLWRMLGTSDGLPGLFYYRAATIGDGICLPILVEQVRLLFNTISFYIWAGIKPAL